MPGGILIVDYQGSIGERLSRRYRELMPRSEAHVRTTVGPAGDGTSDCLWLIGDCFNCVSALAASGAVELNLVIEQGSDSEGAKVRERSVIEECQAKGVSYRVFTTPPVLHESAVDSGVVGAFLSTLFDFEQEIEERAPSYFDYHALRCRAPQQAHLDLIEMDSLVDRLLAISQSSDTLNRSFPLSSENRVTFHGFCETVREVSGSSLLPAEEAEELSAVDLAFEARVNEVSPLLNLLRTVDNPAGATVLSSAQTDGLRDLEKALAAKRRGRDLRVSNMPDSLATITIEHKGYPLTYHAAGRGATPILLLSALGQSSHYWFRLIDELMTTHRVIVWEPRGASLPPHPFTLTDQVEDVEAILRHERAGTCYLVGWCTGPKVAVELAVRRPDAAAAMIFLNPTFRRVGTPPELETAYERNSDPLFRTVAARPTMAGSVRRSLQGGGRELVADAEVERDPKELAAEVISAMSAGLREHVVRPFQSESVLLNYARQIVDFWSYDSLAKADQVRAPILVVASELDQVAHPEMAREAAKLFPRGRLAMVRNATHYCLHDRPRLVAGLIREFLDGAEGLAAPVVA